MVPTAADLAEPRAVEGSFSVWEGAIEPRVIRFAGNQHVDRPELAADQRLFPDKVFALAPGTLPQNPVGERNVVRVNGNDADAPLRSRERAPLDSDARFGEHFGRLIRSGFVTAIINVFEAHSDPAIIAGGTYAAS
jgi:hypothetical protein